jgi:hypothetical protein
MMCTFVLPLCVAFMPVTNDIYVLGTLMAILGLNMGCIDNLGNLAILKLHGKPNVSPFIQVAVMFLSELRQNRGLKCLHF